MTFRTVTVALLAGITGCAIIPLGADDIAICPDGGCPTFTPDGGGFTDAVPGFDGYPEADVPASRTTLCNTSDCNPDMASDCNVVTDSGAPATDASLRACRMVQPAYASCVAAGAGADQASCTSSADCAPGYECVGDGICRHYCCNDDVCTGLGNSSNNETYFCDVAHEKAAPTVTVPVCFLVQPCKPLQTGVCGPNETCTIVETNNSMQLVATCDAIGKGVLGDSCETAQCAAGFACIGPIGGRTCQQLCNTSNPCSGSLTCNMKSQTFGVGICGY